WLTPRQLRLWRPGLEESLSEISCWKTDESERSGEWGQSFSLRLLWKIEILPWPAHVRGEHMSAKTPGHVVKLLFAKLRKGRDRSRTGPDPFAREDYHSLSAVSWCRAWQQTVGRS